MVNETDLNRVYKTPKQLLKIGIIKINQTEVPVYVSRTHIGVRTNAFYCYLKEEWYKIPEGIKWDMK